MCGCGLVSRDAWATLHNRDLAQITCVPICLDDGVVGMVDQLASYPCHLSETRKGCLIACCTKKPTSPPPPQVIKCHVPLAY